MPSHVHSDVTPQAIARHLDSLGCATITPMSIEIAGKVYPAASYAQKFNTPENSPAWHRGERDYWRNGIMVAGMLPACYRHNGKTVFTVTTPLGTDAADWYVGCYSGVVRYHTQDVQLRDAHHPFGNTFILFPWDLAEDIDAHEPRKRNRVKVTVRPMGPEFFSLT